MNNEYANEEWYLQRGSKHADWHFENADANMVTIFSILTVRKGYWSYDHKRDGTIKKGRKKHQAIVAVMAVVWPSEMILESLVTQHNAWINRTDANMMRDYIRDEIEWNTSKVFQALNACQESKK